MRERITYLFMRYYTNKSTREELEEFFELINTAKNDKEINALIKSVYDEIKLNNPSLTYIDEDGKLVLQEPAWLSGSDMSRRLSWFQSRTRLLSTTRLGL